MSGFLFYAASCLQPAASIHTPKFLSTDIDIFFRINVYYKS